VVLLALVPKVRGNIISRNIIFSRSVTFSGGTAARNPHQAMPYRRRGLTAAASPSWQGGRGRHQRARPSVRIPLAVSKEPRKMKPPRPIHEARRGAPAKNPISPRFP